MRTAARLRNPATTSHARLRRRNTRGAEESSTKSPICGLLFLLLSLRRLLLAVANQLVYQRDLGRNQALNVLASEPPIVLLCREADYSVIQGQHDFIAWPDTESLAVLEWYDHATTGGQLCYMSHWSFPLF